jgi:hypothetical protein
MLKQHIPEQFLSRAFEVILNFTHGTPLSGVALQQWLERNKQVMYHILSYIKEMSPSEVEDYQYIGERVWRIVAGANFDGGEVCRTLTDDEKRELGQARSRWLKELTTSDINVQVRYQPSSIIDHFRFFNGIKSVPISRMIDTILVPDISAWRWVRNYVTTNASLFRPGGPPGSIVSVHKAKNYMAVPYRDSDRHGCSTSTIDWQTIFRCETKE